MRSYKSEFEHRIRVLHYLYEHGPDNRTSISRKIGMLYPRFKLMFDGVIELELIQVFDTDERGYHRWTLTDKGIKVLETACEVYCDVGLPEYPWWDR
jgi:hypothetical protein